MSDKVELKELVLKFGNKEIALTPDEAKQLKEILGELFGEEKTVINVPSYPIYIERWYEPRVWRYETLPYTSPTITWCSTFENGTMTLSNSAV